MENSPILSNQLEEDLSLLGMDSIIFISVVIALEEEFDIEIPDADAEKVVTVGDVVEYIKDHVA